jgi:hypothetical protein
MEVRIEAAATKPQAYSTWIFTALVGGKCAAAVFAAITCLTAAAWRSSRSVIDVVDGGSSHAPIVHQRVRTVKPKEEWP